MQALRHWIDTLFKWPSIMFSLFSTYCANPDRSRTKRISTRFGSALNPRERNVTSPGVPQVAIFLPLLADNFFY